MKPIKYGGRLYAPKLRDDGKLTARVSIAYGAGAREGQLMFTVYVQVTATRGRKERTYQLPALRHWQQGGLPKRAQHDYAQFMLDAVAVQQECELHLMQPINTR